MLIDDSLEALLRNPAVSLETITDRVFRDYLPATGALVREPQIAMARAIAHELDEATEEAREDLAIEAPTGSGKGLAYLVPTVLAALRLRLTGDDPAARVLVSTSGIPLQRQLVTKDVPMLARAIGLPVSAAVVKGRSNYVCLLHLSDAEMLINQDLPTVQRIRQWVNAGGSGDREEMPIDASPSAWGRVSVGSDECLSRKCPLFGPCLSQRARMAAQAAVVVVMNHAYVTLGASSWEAHTVALVCDEGHDLEDAARRASSSEIRATAPKYWGQLVTKALDDKATGDLVQAMLQQLIEAAERASGRGESSVRMFSGWCPDDLGRDIHGVLTKVGATVRQTVDGITLSDSTEGARQERRAERIEMLANRVDKAILVPQHLCVWTERREKTFALCQAPIKAHAPAGFKPVVVTSATLGGGDPAEATAALSLDARPMILPPAWPVEEMSVVWVPQMVDPKHGSWPTESARATVAFVKQCGGGCLVLATSWARMRELATILRREVPYRVLLQGEAGRSELLYTFAGDADSILVGTRSMFQGVDVPGNACRGVVIDRIPFPSPGDPMEQAICEAIEREGGDPFRDRSLRIAGQLLRQAVGRLLRTETDRGAIAILDTRVIESRMSGPLLKALSPYPITRDIQDVARVLRGESAIHAVPTTAALPLRTTRPARRLPVG